MKQLLLLIPFICFSAFSFGQSKPKVELMDAAKTEKLKWGEFQYVVMGLKDELVIESKSDIYVDLSAADLRKQEIDSAELILGKDTIRMDALAPFFIKGVDKELELSYRAFSKGDTVTFNSMDSQVLSMKIERHDRPIFVTDEVVFGLLALVLALIFYTSSKQTKFWRIFYLIVPSLLLCYLIPALLDLFGLISKDYSNLYPMARDYLLPAALILMTLGIDYKGLIKLGPKALIMFLTATVGIIIGGPLSIIIYSYIDPEVVGGVGNDAAWRGFSTLAGSWIGGGPNQAAMLEAYSYNQTLYGKMVTVDIVVANLWMAFLLWAAARADKFDRWLKADSTSIQTLKQTMSDYHSSIARKATLTDYMVILGVTFSLVGIGHLAGEYLAGFFDENSPLGSPFIWMVVIVTTGGLVLSATKLRHYEGAGASRLGSMCIYMLVATIGMKMDLAEAIKEPQLILVGIIWMLIHAVLIFAVGKLIRAPFFFIAVGSKANVGGAASAPIVAAAFHPSLASVGAILAVFGYAIGTYGAIFSAKMMEAVAPVTEVIVK